MKTTSSSPGQEIIEILKGLESIKAEYPPELLAARRAAFVAQVAQRRVNVREELASKSNGTLKHLASLKSVEAGYPPELLAARRAAFIAQIAQRRVDVREELTSKNQEILKHLTSVKSVEAGYPPELLAARRAAFIAQVAQRNGVDVKEELTSNNNSILKLLARLKSIDAEYPLKLLAARRVAFNRQIAGWGSISLLEALRSVIQNSFVFKAKTLLLPMMKPMRTSLIVVGLLVATFVGSLIYGSPGRLNQIFNPSPSQNEVAQPVPVLSTNTHEVARTICKPGYVPPLCLAKEFDNGQDLTFQGNGLARPAVAKDTLPGYSGIHRAAYVNDGLYGNGASWVSNSAYSWIKIDLGKTTTINTITFGRDRLGNFNDRDPGQFVIAVALSDNIYADGNSSNDFTEYTQVYDSEQVGFSGTVSGSQTVKAYLGTVVARYVKITFTNSGVAVDEVEVFMVQPPVLANEPVERNRDEPLASTATNVPINTPLPTHTLTLVPTSTPQPTNTPTPVPTSTPQPTNTPTPVPTNTPQPTNTRTPVPTNTPQPTDTPIPVPTDTPLPPTDILFDFITDTPESTVVPIETP